MVFFFSTLFSPVISSQKSEFEISAFVFLPTIDSKFFLPSVRSIYMAGMLPGVEAARRRRFHRSNLDKVIGGGGGGGGSTRRSSFCLYVSNNNELLIGSPSSVGRNHIRQGGFDDEKLDAAAREAKKRLDHRLQTHWKSEIKMWAKGREKSSCVEERLKSECNQQTYV